MALVQIGCSTSNPVDGTAVGTPTGFQAPTTGSGTTRTWRSSVAWRANTGIQISAGGNTDAFRTVVFTGNASVALTGFLTMPASTGVTKTLAVWRTSAGVAFRLQWSASGELTILDTGSTVRVIATAGVLSNSTGYGFQSWVTQAGSGASKLHVLITNTAGTTLATLDSDVVNLGTNLLTHFDFDPGGSAVVYGWSEIQYEDGRTSYIPFWATASAATGTVALSGTGTLSIAVSPTVASSMALTGTGTLATSGAPAVTGGLALTGSGTLTATGSPSGTALVTLVGEGTLATSGKPAMAGLTALAGTGTLATSGAISVTGQVALTGDGALSISDTLSVSAQLDLSGSGASTTVGNPLFTGTAPLAGSGSIIATGSVRATSRVDLTGSGTLTLQGGGSSTGALVARGDGTLTATGTPRINSSSPSVGSGALTLTGTPTARGTSASTSTSALELSGSPVPTSETTSTGQGDLTFIGAPVLTALLLLAGEGLLTLLQTQAGHDITVTGTLGASRWTGTTTTTPKAGCLGPRRWGGHL